MQILPQYMGQVIWNLGVQSVKSSLSNRFQKQNKCLPIEVQGSSLVANIATCEEGRSVLWVILDVECTGCVCDCSGLYFPLQLVINT